MEAGIYARPKHFLKGGHACLQRRACEHHREARQRVASEKRAFVWWFLPGEEGSAAEAAFARFEQLFDKKVGGE